MQARDPGSIPRKGDALTPPFHRIGRHIVAERTHKEQATHRERVGIIVCPESAAETPMLLPTLDERAVPLSFLLGESTARSGSSLS